MRSIHYSVNHRCCKFQLDHQKEFWSSIYYVHCHLISVENTIIDCLFNLSIRPRSEYWCHHLQADALCTDQPINQLESFTISSNIFIIFNITYILAYPQSILTGAMTLEFRTNKRKGIPNMYVGDGVWDLMGHRFAAGKSGVHGEGKVWWHNSNPFFSDISDQLPDN